MDLSNSMGPYKASLERTAESVADVIAKTTPQFRMGFGSFSDKPTAPFSGKMIFDANIFLHFYLWKNEMP